jgi:hypothetical protein
MDAHMKESSRRALDGGNNGVLSVSLGDLHEGKNDQTLDVKQLLAQMSPKDVAEMAELELRLRETCDRVSPRSAQCCETTFERDPEVAVHRY